MIDKRLDQQVDDIIDTLYDAADVPHINRKHVGRQFMVQLGQLVDQTVNDYMESADDPTEDIRDLQTQVDELSKDINQMKQQLDKRGLRMATQKSGVIVAEKEEQILRQIENAQQLIKDDNYLDACRSLEIAIDLMHMTGKTGKPL